jgi:hypothetical protein
MTDEEKADGFIRQFIVSVGVDPVACYDPSTKAYYLTKGTVRLEVYVYTDKGSGETPRRYLRIFSHIANVPTKDKESFYLRLLELNDSSLGVKLTVMPNSQKVYATFERDIAGISAQETATCITDMGLWADYLDDVLAKEFSEAALPQAVTAAT